MTTKNLVLHIGPSKTASTSLQYYFHNLKLNGVYYLGVYEPRKKNDSAGNNDFRHKVYSYAKKKDKKLYTDINNEIERYFENNNTLIFSEEMILHDFDWKEKLKNLQELFKCYSIDVIVMWRDPRSAVPSYYRQIHKNLSHDLQADYQKFENIYSELYNCKKVYKVLHDIGYDSIKWISFEELVRGNINLIEILKHGQVLDQKKIILEKRNSKSQTNQVLYRKSLADYVRDGVKFYVRDGLLGKVLRKTRMMKVLNRLTVRKKLIDISPSEKMGSLHIQNHEFIKQLSISNN